MAVACERVRVGGLAVPEGVAVVLPWWPRAKGGGGLDRRFVKQTIRFRSLTPSLVRGLELRQSQQHKNKTALTLISSHVARSWSAARSRAERTTRRASSESDESEPTRNLFGVFL